MDRNEGDLCVSRSRPTAAWNRLRVFPTALRILSRDLFSVRSAKRLPPREHLEATMEWLCRAHDAAGGGVSAGSSLAKGWLPSYPETTGYLIPTFFDYARFSGNNEFRQRACAMADWELDIQLVSGAVPQCGAPDGSKSAEPAAFDTGQVILGWC